LPARQQYNTSRCSCSPALLSPVSGRMSPPSARPAGSAVLHCGPEAITTANSSSSSGSNEGYNRG
jgi:hypothetical protein